VAGNLGLSSVANRLVRRRPLLAPGTSFLKLTSTRNDRVAGMSRGRNKGVLLSGSRDADNAHDLGGAERTRRRRNQKVLRHQTHPGRSSRNLMPGSAVMLMTLMAATALGVPLKGSFVTLALGTLLYVGVATAIGLLASVFMRSQIAAVFGTSIATMVPAINFSGVIYPVSSLQGVGAVIGTLFPTTPYLTISRGAFSRRWRARCRSSGCS
jgi:hypothetical protein